MLDYFQGLTKGKVVLWCYLLWYLVVVGFHFDPAPRLWLNSLGISAVIGIALQLSVQAPGQRRDPWQTFRLFAMPFCVSSFSSLIKGQGFYLFVPPHMGEALTAVGACTAFVLVVALVKRLGGASGGRAAR